jgi:hypothetical protein
MVVDADGIGLVLRPDRIEEPYRDGARDALAALAAGLLSARLAAGLERLAGSVVVDDRGGLGLPETAAERMELALRRGAAAVRLERGRLALTAGLRRRLLAACRLGIGAGVDRFEPADTVRFKRHRAPQHLDDRAQALVAVARDGGRVADARDPAAVLALVEAGVLGLDAAPALAELDSAVSAR